MLFRGTKRRVSRVALAGVAVLALVGVALAGSYATASAASGCGGEPADGNVYINCALPNAGTPYTQYTDGQAVNLSFGANATFSTTDSYGGDIVAMECEYTTGTVPGDPPNASYCNATTAAGDFPEAVSGVDGSFDYTAQNSGDQAKVYAQPDNLYAHAAIHCDLTHPCVYYVGENYLDFTKPHVFSNPFVVGVSPRISSSSSASATIGQPVNFVVNASLGTTAPLASPVPNLTMTGTLPSGVYFSDNHDGTATLLGSPVDGTVGSSMITVTAANGTANNATQTITLTVNKATLTVSASSSFMYQGGVPPAILPTYAGFVGKDKASTALTTPATCSTAATGASAPGTYASSCTGLTSANYVAVYVPGTVQVMAHPQILTLTPLPAATADGVSAYSFTFSATGGLGPYSWKMVGGALPHGLKFKSGLLSGVLKTSDVAGPYSFTIQATTAKSKVAGTASGSTLFTLTVNP
jgi:hypothetical protein